MKVETHQCDECQVLKQDSNHWLLVSLKKAALHLYPWDAEVPERDEMKHLCGQGCASKLFSRTIEEWAKTEG